jgi:hypothetical protein
MPFVTHQKRGGNRGGNGSVAHRLEAGLYRCFRNEPLNDGSLRRTAPSANACR